MRNYLLLITFLFCLHSLAQNIEQKKEKIIEEIPIIENDSISEVNLTLDDSSRNTTFKTRLLQLITGYQHHRPHKNETYKYNGLLSTFAFNAVQGFNVTTGLSYLKEYPSDATYYEIGGLVNYGLAENKPRFSGYYSHLFHIENKSKITLSGGLTVHQFGEDFPIKNLINSLASSYFGRNYAKFYQKNYISAHYQQAFSEHLFGSAELKYAHRKPLFNNTLHSPFVKKRLFSSNNPIDPADFENPGFEQNHIVKLKLKTVVNFDKKQRFPLVYLNFETGFASNVSKYNYALVGFSTLYQQDFNSFGALAVFVNAGWFLDAQDIAFMDYKHFYGNETFIGTTKNYLQNFNLLPYYSYSTNNSFSEWHAEYDFNGFLTDNIPVFGQLQWHLITGAHALFSYNHQSYYEVSVGLNNIGFKKFRPLRIDFFQSFHRTEAINGIVVGIKVLDR